MLRQQRAAPGTIVVELARAAPGAQHQSDVLAVQPPQHRPARSVLRIVHLGVVVVRSKLPDWRVLPHERQLAGVHTRHFWLKRRQQPPVEDAAEVRTAPEGVLQVEPVALRHAAVGGGNAQGGRPHGVRRRGRADGRDRRIGVMEFLHRAGITAKDDLGVGRLGLREELGQCKVGRHHGHQHSTSTATMSATSRRGRAISLPPLIRPPSRLISVASEQL